MPISFPTNRLQINTQSKTVDFKEGELTPAQAKDQLYQIAQNLIDKHGNVKTGKLRLRKDGDALKLTRGRWGSGYSASSALIKKLVGTAYGESSKAYTSLETYLAERGNKVGTRSLVKLVAAMDERELFNQKLKIKLNQGDALRGHLVLRSASDVPQANDQRDSQAQFLSSNLLQAQHQQLLEAQAPDPAPALSHPEQAAAQEAAQAAAADSELPGVAELEAQFLKDIETLKTQLEEAKDHAGKNPNNELKTLGKLKTISTKDAIQKLEKLESQTMKNADSSAPEKLHELEAHRAAIKHIDEQAQALKEKIIESLSKPASRIAHLHSELNKIKNSSSRTSDQKRTLRKHEDIQNKLGQLNLEITAKLKESENWPTFPSASAEDSPLKQIREINAKIKQLKSEWDDLEDLLDPAIETAYKALEKTYQTHGINPLPPEEKNQLIKNIRDEYSIAFPKIQISKNIEEAQKNWLDKHLAPEHLVDENREKFLKEATALSGTDTEEAMMMVRKLLAELDPQTQVKLAATIKNESPDLYREIFYQFNPLGKSQIKFMGYRALKQIDQALSIDDLKKNQELIKNNNGNFLKAYDDNILNLKEHIQAADEETRAQICTFLNKVIQPQTDYTPTQIAQDGFPERLISDIESNSRELGQRVADAKKDLNSQNGASVVIAPPLERIFHQIVCRHLSSAYADGKIDALVDIGSAKNQDIFRSRANLIYELSPKSLALPKDRLMRALLDTADKMKVMGVQREGMYLILRPSIQSGTESGHALAITIEQHPKNPNSFVFSFYDPNLTQLARRMEYTPDPDGGGKLDLDGLTLEFDDINDLCFHTDNMFLKEYYEENPMARLCFHPESDVEFQAHEELDYVSGAVESFNPKTPYEFLDLYKTIASSKNVSLLKMVREAVKKNVPTLEESAGSMDDLLKELGNLSLYEIRVSHEILKKGLSYAEYDALQGLGVDTHGSNNEVMARIQHLIQNASTTAEQKILLHKAENLLKETSRINDELWSEKNQFQRDLEKFIHFKRWIA